jgi:hypothetical protein
VPIPKSIKCAALLTDDKEANPDHQYDQPDRPENNADLGEIVREQQDDTKNNHGAPALQNLLYAQMSGFMQRNPLGPINAMCPPGADT